MLEVSPARWDLVFDRRLEAAFEPLILPHTFTSRIVMTDIPPEGLTVRVLGYISQNLDLSFTGDAASAAYKKVVTRPQVHVLPNWGLPYQIEFKGWYWVTDIRLKVWEYNGDESFL